MLILPGMPEFRLTLDNVAGTRPATGFGDTITPGNNTMGTTVTLFTGAEVTHDCYGILLNVNSINVAAAAKDALLTITIDPAGGTSWTDFLPGLIVSCAPTLVIGGVWYYFPIFIPAGASIGAKGSTNNATVGTMRVWCRLFGQPSRPDAINVGTVFRSFGVNTGTSDGTVITEGTTSEGSWTQVGSATDAALWWWQVGYGTNDTTMTALTHFVDLAAGPNTTNPRILVSDLMYMTDTSERIWNFPHPNCYGRVSVGENIYIRAQCSGTPDADISVAAYGVG